jgi:hypothetical protein
MSGKDETVTSVITLAAANDYATGAFQPQSLQEVSNATPGVFHKN